MKPLAIVVLAAGCSSRLGQNKQLISIEGQALITRQCRELLLLNLPIYCVLGYQAEQVALELQSLPQINIIENTQWSEGLGGSIATATEALKSQFERLLFLLGDQWQLNADKLSAFIQASDSCQTKITVATSNINCSGATISELSPPVIFHQGYYNELCLLQGKPGAKTVLKKHLQQVNAYYLLEAFSDLDTPEQLNALRIALKPVVPNS